LCCQRILALRGKARLDCREVFVIVHVRRLLAVELLFGHRTGVVCARSTNRRSALLFQGVHQEVECLVEFLDAFVLELLGGLIQINPHLS